MKLVKSGDRIPDEMKSGVYKFHFEYKKRLRIGTFIGDGIFSYLLGKLQQQRYKLLQLKQLKETVEH